jgi:hypothetical protein
MSKKRNFVAGCFILSAFLLFLLIIGGGGLYEEWEGDMFSVQEAEVTKFEKRFVVFMAKGDITTKQRENILILLEFIKREDNYSMTVMLIMDIMDAAIVDEILDEEETKIFQELCDLTQEETGPTLVDLLKLK